MLQAARDLGLGIESICGGRLALALAVLAQATQRRELTALIDGADALDPSGAAEQGVDLRRMLWARVRNGNEALRAADMVLGAGGISLVVLYLVCLLYTSRCV